MKFTIVAEQLFSTGCDKQVCAHGTLWLRHYITTGKKYL